MNQDNSDSGPKAVHPTITEITDALAFRMARFVLINDRIGGANFSKRFGITLNEWRVLGLAYAMKGPKHADVARVLMMDKGQLSRIVQGLLARGLVQNAPSPGDARALSLLLTEAGEDLHSLVTVESQRRNDKIVEVLSPDECTQFLSLLDRLIEHAKVRATQDGIET